MPAIVHVFSRYIPPMGSTLAEDLPDLSHAPRVLACCDLHVNSFGTWRDSEGRLAWGVDDFDDSYPLPYTNDLEWLAASVKIVKDPRPSTTGLKKSCDIICRRRRGASQLRSSFCVGGA